MTSSTTKKILREMQGIDPHGPCPIEYHKAELWRCMRAGIPPTTTTCMFGTCYAIPTNYHERQMLEEVFGEHKVKK